MATIQKRITKNGKISFRVQIRIKGHPPESATFDRLTDAKRWAQSAESGIRENRYFKTSQSRKFTVNDLIDRYLARIKRDNPKRIKDIEPMLAWWKAEIGYCVLGDLSRALLAEKVDILSQRTVKRRIAQSIESKQVPISPARINRYMAALSHACTVAVNEWEWLETNPMQKLKKLREPRGRVRFLDKQERAALLISVQNSNYKPLYLIVALALSTGARKSEIMNLRWADVDITRRQIIFQETKNGDRRSLPLTDLSYELIRSHMKVQRIDTNLVFPSARGDKPYEIKKCWESALKEAGIRNFRFHDLRHSAASYLAMSGATLAEIAEILGHRTLAMVKRYAHLTEAHTAEVLGRMNDKVFQENNTTF